MKSFKIPDPEHTITPRIAVETCLQSSVDRWASVIIIGQRPDGAVEHDAYGSGKDLFYMMDDTYTFLEASYGKRFSLPQQLLYTVVGIVIGVVVSRL